MSKDTRLVRILKDVRQGKITISDAQNKIERLKMEGWKKKKKKKPQLTKSYCEQGDVDWDRKIGPMSNWVNGD